MIGSLRVRWPPGRRRARSSSRWGHRVPVSVTTSTMSASERAARRSSSTLHTHVREDAIVLYGFAHDDERRCFEALLGAHGVGPALRAGHPLRLSPAQLSTAVLEDDLDTLCSVPGVGRKTAARS